jgi:CBS domain-containing protein
MLGLGLCARLDPELPVLLEWAHRRRREAVSEDKVRTEEFSIDGDQLLAKVKELLREGNIRRIVIKNEQGRTLIDIPLTVGLLGALVKPKLVLVAAIAAVFTSGSIVVEKVEK